MSRAARHQADLELVRRVLGGDEQARADFVRRLRCVPAYLRARARRRGLPLSSAQLEDLSQDTLLALWRKLSTFRGTSTIETWACGYCHYQLASHLERSARLSRRVGEFEGEPAMEAAAPDDVVEHVERALSALGPPAEDVVRLKHFEELSFPEIGERMGLSANTAKSHYYRGLARLRGALGRLLSSEAE